MIIVCVNCKKPLTLDETKLPMKEVTFPCPACKAKLSVDRSKGAAQKAPAGETSAAAPAAKSGNGRDTAARASVVATQCTSCKKTLEIEQASLSPREPTVLKCPSCGTTLTVDKRKLEATLGAGPIVRVASESYKPLPAPPAEDEVMAAGETGEYLRIVSDLYAGAEQYLETVIEIGTRSEALEEARRRGSAALEAIAVPAPAATDHYARDVVHHPELRTVDGALMTESWYLHTVRGITEAAVRLHTLLRAPQTYAPAVEWQKATWTTLSDAYAAAVERSPHLASNLERLRETESAYVEVCARHGRDRRELEQKLAAHAAHMGGLASDITATQERIVGLEATAKRKGKAVIFEGGGCVVGVVAAIGAIVLGIAAKSGEVTFLMFVLLGIAGLYLAYHIGYNRNDGERLAAGAHLERLRADESQAYQENTYFRKVLAQHLDAAPDAIAKTIPIAAWSPITTTDFDDRRPSLVAAPASAKRAPRTAGAPTADAASP